MKTSLSAVSIAAFAALILSPVFAFPADHLADRQDVDGQSTDSVSGSVHIEIIERDNMIRAEDDTCEDDDGTNDDNGQQDDNGDSGDGGALPVKGAACTAPGKYACGGDNTLYSCSGTSVWMAMSACPVDTACSVTDTFSGCT